MHSRKRKNNIIIASLLAVVLIMGIGYAAFSSKLNINGTGSVSGNWDIKITNMKSIPTGGAYNIKDPTWEDLTASFFVGLTSPGDSMVYEIEVTNSGNINAKLEDLKVNMGNNKAITYDINGLDIGDTLEANSTITFNLIISFDSNITSMPDDVTSNIELKLDYSQDSNSSNSDIDYGTLTKPTVTVDYTKKTYSIDYHYDCNSYVCTYTFNDGAVVTVNSNPTVSFTEDGIINATVTSGSDKGITVAYIDTTVPTLKGVTLTKATGIYKVTVNAEDKVSGIQKYEFRKGTTWTNKKLNNSISVIADSISDINLGIRVTDKVGNIKEITYRPALVEGTIQGTGIENITVLGNANITIGAGVPVGVTGSIIMEESE